MSEFEQIKNSINTVLEGIDRDRQIEILEKYLGNLILESVKNAEIIKI